MVKIPRSAIPATYLPKGWMVVTTTRRKGNSKGHQDKTYYNPSFEKFRSLRAVHEHIAATDHAATDHAATAPVAAAPEIVLVEDSSSDEDNGDESIADKINTMQEVANNEQHEGIKAVHEIFIAELKMLLAKKDEGVQDEQAFLVEKIEYWEQSLANLPDNDASWNRIAHLNHIHELKLRQLQLSIDAFIDSDDDDELAF